MTLLHLLCLDVAALIGMEVGISIGHLPHGLGVLAIPFGLMIFLSLAWPLMRLIGVRPIFFWCPSCSQGTTGFHSRPVDQGLEIICAGCGGTAVLKGRWISERVGHRFRFDEPITALLLDEEGHPTAHRQATWPYWLVRWGKLQPATPSIPTQT